MRRPYRFSLLLLAGILLSACHRVPPEEAARGSDGEPQIRNVIIMIGDGMGPQQIGLLVAYAHHASHSVYRSRGGKTALERLMDEGTLGYARNEPADALVADSAASSTQMATGEWARAEMIGLDQNGNVLKTVLEMAEERDKSTGLVTDTRLTHATPAGFAAHQTHRSKEGEIAVDLLEAGVDVMLGGGLEWWLPRDANDASSQVHRKLAALAGGTVRLESKRQDSRNLLEEARLLGYEICLDKRELGQATRERILGLFAPYGLMGGIEEKRTRDDPDRRIPTLREMTAKALEVLSRNRRGFFLMVEAGLIDWAGHDNDTGSLLHEMLKFDETVEQVHEWARKRDDTLLLITGDHETGGFGFSCSRRNLPAPQTLPGEPFQGETFQPRQNYGNYGILDRIYNQKLSYPQIMERFDALPQDQQTPKALAEIIAQNTEFPITEAEAATIVGPGPKESPLGREGFEGDIAWSKLHDDAGFYPEGKELRNNRLACVVAKDQMTVWATGMHTNTPVPLIAYGPPQVSSRYGKMMHNTEWGRETIEVLLQGE